MAKAPRNEGSTFNPMKWLKAASGSPMAARIDADERKFAQQQKTAKKDRISDVERSKLIAALRADNNRPAGSNVSVEDYITKLFREGSSTTVDNERIRKMVPEIAQASAFMVSAIISPNDLRQGEISIKNDETSLNEEQKRELETYLKEYFEERFKLSVNLPKWIDEALYNSGAKCLLTIPMSSIEKQVLQDGVSNESFDKINKSLESMGSLFGISSDVSYSCESLAERTCSVGIESFEALKDSQGSDSNKINESKFSKDWSKLVSSITSTESIHISDNPFILRTHHLQNDIAAEALEGKLARMTAIDNGTKKDINKVVQRNLLKKKLLKDNSKSKRQYWKPDSKESVQAEKKDKDEPQPFVQMTHTENDHVGEPLFMEVPTESIVPIFIPGSESETLGYLAIIDENGHFANIAGDRNTKNGPNRYDRGDRYNFNQIYQAAGYNINQGGMRSSEAQNVMSKLYQSIVEGYLDEKVRGAGYKNFKLGSNPSVYKYMFSQYLCNKQTRMLYIPADMLTYLTFEHGPDGRGVSDIEKVKYALSLKMSLETSKTISQLNAAVDRKKLTLNTEGGNNNGNILQQIESLQREYLQKNRWSMTSDPRQTANEILEKGLSVKVTGIEGLNYDITEENNVKEAAPIDETLLESLSNQVRMGLSVPAAAMNATGEDEYARSVVTSNLFTANLVMCRQRTVTFHVSDMLRAFTRYSPSLRQGILEIISTTQEDESAKTENGNIDPEKLTMDDKERLNDVIDSIFISLPPPNIAPNKAMYEVINDVASASENLINSLYPDELVGSDNPSLQLAMQAFKSYAKSKYIQDTIDNNGMDSGFVINLEDIDSNDIGDFRQYVANLSKALQRQIKAMKIDEDNEKAQQAGGGGMDGGFGGGMDSGGFGGDSGGFGGGDMGGGFGGDDAGGFADSTGGEAPNDGDSPGGGF